MPANLSVMVESLEDQGFRVLVALDGLEALERAEFSQPDLILLDVKMPGIDGYETCRRLKSNSDTSDIPVIFMTSMSATADVVEGLAAGGVDYVTKPIRVDEVVARIGTHLALRTLAAAACRRATCSCSMKLPCAKRRSKLYAMPAMNSKRGWRNAPKNSRGPTPASTLRLSERRGVEARLKKSEARFRAIVETSPVPLCITSMPEGDILYMNQPMRELFALDATQPVIGNIIDFYAAPTNAIDWCATCATRGTCITQSCVSGVPTAPRSGRWRTHALRLTATFLRSM